jgi:hypothetical protein
MERNSVLSDALLSALTNSPQTLLEKTSLICARNVVRFFKNKTGEADFVVILAPQNFIIVLDPRPRDTSAKVAGFLFFFVLSIVLLLVRPRIRFECG